MLHDPAPRRPMRRGEKIAAAACTVVFTGLLLAELASNFEPVKLTFLFMVLFWVPALVVHELGHALAAWSVGWRVSEIVIGFGAELFRFRYSGTAVRVHLLMLEGYVVPSPGNASYNRLKSAWIYFGGPGAELLVAWLLLRFVSTTPLGDAESMRDIVAQGFTASLLIGVVSTLFPYVPSPGQASDGLGILLSWLRKPESFEEHRAAPELAELRDALAMERLDRADELLVEAAAKFPSDERFSALGAVALALRGEGDAAFRRLEEIGPPEKHRPPGEAEMLHAAGWCVLAGAGTGEPVLDAERACRRALEIAGDDPVTLTTLGALMLARGRRRDALDVLMDAYKACRRPDQEQRALAYLVIAARRSDESQLASDFLGALRVDELGPSLRSQVEQGAGG